MTAEMFALLTRIRIPGASMDLRKAARQQHLFPLVGLVAGLIAALAAVILDDLLGNGMALVVGGVVLCLLHLINGMLHTEGLEDFADGLMAGGTQEQKRAAMKDVHCGAGGVFAIVLYMVVFYGLVVTLCERASSDVPTLLPWSVTAAVGFVIAEMSGKLAVVTAIYVGPSSHPGMGSLFVHESSPAKVLVAIGISAIAAATLTGLLFPIVLTGVVVGAWIALRARKDLGGVSGDVFGAANELGRFVALFGWVLLL